MLGMTAVLARVFLWLCHRSISDVDLATAMRAPPISGAAITNLILELVIVAGSSMIGVDMGGPVRSGGSVQR